MLNFKQKSDQELMKHMCNLCNKSFPCGRSLGVHMRCHVINSTLPNNGPWNSNDLGYELRKDPKKTLKAVINRSSDSNDFVGCDKVCKQCGKNFQSWKALFGHMKCHSHKVSNTKSMICDQDSWISKPKRENSGREVGQVNKSRSRNRETKGSIVTSTSVTTTTNTASSSVSMNGNHETSVVSDIYDEQEVDIAMCLIMLSRDVRKWDKDVKNLKKTSESRDKTVDQNKRKKFECATCNKSFHSYQALGGHKASHKKLNGCFEVESTDKDVIKTEPMLDHDHITNVCCEKAFDDNQSTSNFNLDCSLKNTKVVGAYECSICLKVFSSGQALGGHKRSHLIAEAKLNQQNLNQVEKDDKLDEIRGLLDLNMPPDDHMEEEEEQEVTIVMKVKPSSTVKGYNFMVLQS